MIPGFMPVLLGSWTADQGAYPPEVSGVGTQASDWGTHPSGHFGPVCPGSRADGLGLHIPSFGPVAWAAGLLIRVRAYSGFQVWAPSPLIWVPANCASGVFWGCLSGVHSPGAEGVEVQEATAATESSLKFSK